MKSYAIKPDFHANIPTVSHGSGIYLYDTAGKQYIDGCSGAVTTNIGHANEEVIEAMVNQAKRLSFAHRGHWGNEPAEELAKQLTGWTPGDLNYTFFVSSGSEAVEQAQKIAIQYWQELGYNKKTKVISRWVSYHGNTLGALSMSGHVLRRLRYTSILNDSPVVNPPYPYRFQGGLTEEQYALQAANELETSLQRIGADHVAAFIAEPVIGATGGAIVPPANYFKRIREICDQYGILFIADEVMTGMGRTGRNFGLDHWDIVPDIIATGKGISSGYTPLAGTIISEKIFETIRNGSGAIGAGHTYSANPQSAATCLAVLKVAEQNGLVANAAIQGEYLLFRMKQLAERFPLIGEARGLGLLCGLEFVKQKATRESFPPSVQVTKRMVQSAFQKGLVIYPSAGAVNGVGDAIMVAPPLIVTREQIDAIMEILEAAISEVQNELQAEGQLKV